VGERSIISGAEAPMNLGGADAALKAPLFHSESQVNPTSRKRREKWGTRRALPVN